MFTNRPSKNELKVDKRMEASSSLYQLGLEKSSLSKYTDEPSESTPPTDCDDESRDSSLSSIDVYDDGLEVKLIPQKIDSDDEFDKVEKLRLASDPLPFSLDRLKGGKEEVPCAVECDTEDEDSSLDSGHESCHKPSHTELKPGKHAREGRSTTDESNYCNIDEIESSEECSDHPDKYRPRTLNAKW